jgi:DNA-binding NarL/FixJ family response regulator
MKKPDRQPMRFVVCGDRDLVRLGIYALLQKHWPNAHICEARIDQVQAVIAKRSPHVIVFDADEHSEHQRIVREIAIMPKTCGLVVLTSSDNRNFVRSLYAVGSSAVLMKQHSKEALISAVQRVVAGDVWIERPMLNDLFARHESSRVAAKHSDSGKGGREHILTPREREIVRALAKGYRNKRIGVELGISEATVRHHLTTIFGKLRVTDRLELLLYAQNNQLVQTDNLSIFASH